MEYRVNEVGRHSGLEVLIFQPTPYLSLAFDTTGLSKHTGIVAPGIWRGISLMWLIHCLVGCFPEYYSSPGSLVELGTVASVAPSGSSPKAQSRIISPPPKALLSLKLHCHAMLGLSFRILITSQCQVFVLTTPLPTRPHRKEARKVSLRTSPARSPAPCAVG